MKRCFRLPGNPRSLVTSLPFILATATAAWAQTPEPAEAEPGMESSSSAGKQAAAGAPEPAEAEAAPTITQPKRRAAGLGVAPDDTLVSGQSVGIKESSASDEWDFTFKGFFRAPMRISHGTSMGQSQFHAPPVIPDGNYTNWQYTNLNPGPWVEMLFQYGNSRAKMTTALASYNITTGGFREVQAQLGIDRAFLTLNFPEALGELGGLSWNVGVFSDRYGAAGRYDAGVYETYLFGKTRVAGETLRGSMFLSDDLVLLIDHGIGAKLDQQRWTARAVAPAAEDSYQSYEPYPGPRQQGSTLLHHAHIGLAYQDMVTATFHYLDTWTRDLRATAGQRDGNIRVLGADLKLIGGWLGEGYIGFSHIKATNATAVSDSIEVLHSQGGWQLANNYLGDDGNGSLSTLLLQYRFSLAAFLLKGQDWWGDGADLVVHLFGMYNKVDSGVDIPRNGSGKTKLKWGTDVLYTPLPMLGIGGRFDMVQPDLDVAQRSFAVLSPRLVLRTNFVTHEQVAIQYSLYSTKSMTSLPHPFGGEGAPFPASSSDKGVFTISATMWW